MFISAGGEKIVLFIEMTQGQTVSGVEPQPGFDRIQTRGLVLSSVHPRPSLGLWGGWGCARGGFPSEFIPRVCCAFTLNTRERDDVACVDWGDGSNTPLKHVRRKSERPWINAKKLRNFRVITDTFTRITDDGQNNEQFNSVKLI